MEKNHQKYIEQKERWKEKQMNSINLKIDLKQANGELKYTLNQRNNSLCEPQINP